MERYPSQSPKGQLKPLMIILLSTTKLIFSANVGYWPLLSDGEGGRNQMSDAAAALKFTVLIGRLGWAPRRKQLQLKRFHWSIDANTTRWHQSIPSRSYLEGKTKN